LQLFSAALIHSSFCKARLLFYKTTLTRLPPPQTVITPRDDYVARLSEQGVAAVGLPWENDLDEDGMLDKLRSGQVSALVLSTGFVSFIAATQCEFLAVGLPFSIADQVYGLASRIPLELVEDIDKCVGLLVGVVEF